MTVVCRQIDHQRRNVFGELIAEFRGIGRQHLRNAGDLRGGFHNRAAIAAGDQNVGVTTDLGSGCNGAQRGFLEFAAFMFGDYQIAHS